MRAVVLGLVGVVLLAGGAQAGACKLDGLRVVAEPLIADDVVRKDVLGQEFRVVHVSSRFDPTGGEGLQGMIVVEIAHDSERFVVAQEYTPRGMPQVYGVSFKADDPAASKFRSSHRDNSGEGSTFSGTFDIYDGPLSGIALAGVNCR